MCNLKIKTNEQIDQKQTDRYSEKIDGQKGVRVGGVMKKVKGIKKYKFLVVK